MLPSLCVAFVRIGHDRRDCFSQAVAFDQPRAGTGLELVLDALGQRRRPDEDALEAVQVVLAHVGHVAKRHEHGRHADEEGRLGLLDGLEHVLGLETGHQHDLGAGQQRRVHSDAHAEAVEQRQHGQHALLRPHVDPGLQLVRVGHQGEVRQHDALGGARRAAAVDQHRHIVGRYRLRLPVLGQCLLEQASKLDELAGVDPCASDGAPAGLIRGLTGTGGSRRCGWRSLASAVSSRSSGDFLKEERNGDDRLSA